jgi:hypothetical protein
MSFTFRMCYQGDTLRVWFTPEEVVAAGIDKPQAEVPLAKDLWVRNEARVLTCPPMSEEVAAGSAQLLFGGAIQGTRYPNPEIAGGHISLIATNNNPVQEPLPLWIACMLSFRSRLRSTREFRKQKIRSQE